MGPELFSRGGGLPEFKVRRSDRDTLLGRALGHFIFSLIGLKRILFTIIFAKALNAPPSLE